MMIARILAEGGDTSPTPTSGSHSVDLLVTVIVAVIAALPGVLGLIYSWRKRKDVKNATATEFGTKLAETAFKNMETQVTRLTSEQARWDEERDQWERDKNQLLSKISDMTDQLQVTNTYLQMLLATLDIHGIERPPPPPGFRRTWAA